MAGATIIRNIMRAENPGPDELVALLEGRLESENTKLVIAIKEDRFAIFKQQGEREALADKKVYQREEWEEVRLKLLDGDIIVPQDYPALPDAQCNVSAALIERDARKMQREMTRGRVYATEFVPGIGRMPVNAHIPEWTPRQPAPQLVELPEPKEVQPPKLAGYGRNFRF